MDKTVFELPEKLRAVGVVKGSDAPLVEKLLTENENPSYEVALPAPRSFRKWIPALGGIPLVVSLISLLDSARLTR